MTQLQKIPLVSNLFFDPGIVSRGISRRNPLITKQFVCNLLLLLLTRRTTLDDIPSRRRPNFHFLKYIYTHTPNISFFLFARSHTTLFHSRLDFDSNAPAFYFCLVTPRRVNSGDFFFFFFFFP